MVTCLVHAHHTASLLLPSSQLDVWDPISWMFATQIFKVIGHFKLRNFWQLLQKLVEKAVEFNSSQLIFRQEFLKYVLEILLLKTSFFDKNFRSEFRIDHSLKNTNQLIFPFPECSGYPVPLTWGRLEFDPGRKQVILFFFFECPTTFMKTLTVAQMLIPYLSQIMFAKEI